MAPPDGRKRKQKRREQPQSESIDGEKKMKKQKKEKRQKTDKNDEEKAMDKQKKTQKQKHLKQQQNVEGKNFKGSAKKDRKKHKASSKGNSVEEENEEMAVVPSVARHKRGVVTDPRFASVHSDPRFQRLPKKQSKVTIDSRFDRMFHHKSFASSSAPVDKFGKRRTGKMENHMRHYYIHQDEPSKGEKSFESAGGEETEDQLDELEPMDLKEEDVTDSDSDSDTTSSSEEDYDDQCAVGSDVVPYYTGNHKDTPQIDESTHRLAVHGMDWNHIKAVDIYVIMSSSLPKDGHILSVAVYPSNFGMKCMEVEEAQGPSGLIYGTKESNDEDNEDFDCAAKDDQGDEAENGILRSYEINRLRYHFAVVVCDSISTADHLYKNLDGIELLKTSNYLDLQYIPDSIEFNQSPRDITTEAPIGYTPPDFHFRALQHSNVKLSWDEDEPQRKKILRQNFNANQIDDHMYDSFLASDEEENDDEDTTELPNGEAHGSSRGYKYRALLQEDSSDDAVDDQDMEITFNTGLEDIAKCVYEKKANRSESVWEAYLRKRKEKKKVRKKNAKHSSEDDESDSDHQEATGDPDQPDDFFVEETLETDVNTSKKGNKDLSKNKAQKDKIQTQDYHKEQEASHAELELLCANSNRAESPSKEDNIKPGKVKGKKSRKFPQEDKLPKEDYLDDPRFSVLFNSHLFALDPTDPQFKRSAAYARQILHKQKDGSSSAKTEKPLEQAHQIPDDPSLGKFSDSQVDEISSGKDNQDVMSLVKSLKRKAGSFNAEKKSR